jgi:hypothetical protein
MYDWNEARKEQDKFCEARGWPNFAEAATGYHGRCPACGRCIYDKNGYTVEMAAHELITGCPFCNKSFVD